MAKKNYLRLLGNLLFVAALLGISPLAAAGRLTPAQEAALFSLAVEIYASDSPELKGFHRLLPQAWEEVRLFYARLGVLLDMVPAGPVPGKLEAGKRLRFEALTHKQWLAATFKAFEVAPPFRLRFQTVCRDKYAFAHLNLSTIHLDFCGGRSGEAKLGPERLAHLMIHELGHLFGLYHAHEFVNDPIPEYLPDGKTPNFMSHHLLTRGSLGFVDFQKRLIHSYLGGGKVFQQYRHVDFDPLRYLELLKQHNSYREPKEEKGRSSDFPSNDG